MTMFQKKEIKINKNSIILISIGLAFALTFLLVTFKSNNIFAATTCRNNNGSNWFGRDDQCGYFTNGYDKGSGLALFEDGMVGINGKVEFINRIENYLNSGDIRKERGAAFIVLTMQGFDAHTDISSIQGAKDTLGDWKAIVNYSEIDWKKNVDYQYNTFWQNSGGQANDNDVAGYPESSSADAIVFKYPSDYPDVSKRGDIWGKIKKDCGNPIGRFTPLKPPEDNSTKKVRSLAFVKNSNTWRKNIDVSRGETYQVYGNFYNPDAVPGSETFSWDRYEFNVNAAGTGLLPAIGNVGAGTGSFNITNNTGSLTNDNTHTFQIPQDAANGSSYCIVARFSSPDDRTWVQGTTTYTVKKQIYAVSPSAPIYRDGQGLGNGVSIACATVRVWNIGASSSPRTIVRKNDPYTITHTVCNNGPGPNYSAINVSVDGVNSAQLPRLTGPGGCRNYPKPIDTSTIGEKCSTLNYSPIADNNGGTNQTTSCVWVIDPQPVAVTNKEFEKGSPAPTLTLSLNPSGTTCPGAGYPEYTVIAKWTLNINGLITDTVPVIIGGGRPCTQLNIDLSSQMTPARLDFMNKSVPGTAFPFSIEVVGYGVPSNGNITVVEVPYARFYGSDVYSQGLPFFNAPSVADLGGNPGALGWGSTSQFAVFAAAGGSGISGIDLRSAGFRTTGRPNRVEDLKARISPPPVTNVDSLCQKPTTITANLPSASDGACYISTDSYGLSGNYGNKRLTYITSGDVTIDGNITNSIVADSSVKSSADIPILVIKANNIKINSNVTRIDAILVANGNINTCDNVARASWNNNCNTNLTVNGAMYANNINFQRSIGTRLMGRKDEDTKNAFSIWSGGFNQGFGKTNLDINAWRVLTTPSDPLYVPNGFAAESINFPTYLYFATPGNGNPNSDTDMSVKSYLNLPPRL